MDVFPTGLSCRDVPVSAALLRVHGSQIAELPLVATPFRFRQLGHCRVLLHVLEKMLINMGVAVLSLPASDEMVGHKGFQGFSGGVLGSGSFYASILFK